MGMNPREVDSLPIEPCGDGYCPRRVQALARKHGLPQIKPVRILAYRDLFEIPEDVEDVHWYGSLEALLVDVDDLTRVVVMEDIDRPTLRRVQAALDGPYLGVVGGPNALTHFNPHTWQEALQKARRFCGFDPVHPSGED